ncbi:MAG TPA: M48 family peptidase, partial [Verrucomicrobiae bacterium]
MILWAALMALTFILVRWAAELRLSCLNERHVRAHGGSVPEPFRGVIDESTYRKSVDYTLAKSRFSKWVETCDTLLLLTVLFSGILPWAFSQTTGRFGGSI